MRNCVNRGARLEALRAATCCGTIDLAVALLLRMILIHSYVV
jgi:hypothetical protein